MCSNFDLSQYRFAEVKEQFGVERSVFTAWQDERTFFPGLQVPIIGPTISGPRVMLSARWGLVPNFYNDPAQAPQPFNARADTVTKYGMFRESFEQRRCIIPLAGFYEWTRTSPKQRYRLAPHEGLFGVAGIYDVWQVGEEPRVISAAMITTDANSLIGTFHDRCPAILPPDRYAAWLDPDADTDDLLKLLSPWPSERMTKAEAPRPKAQRSAARRTKPDATPGLFDAG